ncbi:hypothetical protein KRX54_00485 [Actinomycetaceae bacterium TAE3-ERU4]|nr:hypothetical protein [Actinomycetaceae bacterium TAE3-ERU4]
MTLKDKQFLAALAVQVAVFFVLLLQDSSSQVLYPLAWVAWVVAAIFLTMAAMNRKAAKGRVKK